MYLQISTRYSRILCDLRERLRRYLMNAKQKLHQAKLTKWAALIRQQMESGLPIREWCIQNNQSFHAYNYWKHLLKETMVDSVVPDIVPITPSTGIISSSQSTSITTVPSRDLSELRNSPDLHNPYNSVAPTPVSISLGDVRIEIGSNGTDEIITNIIKAVRHA